MPESVCLSMILENALGRSLSPPSNSSWCICFTDPRGARRKPSSKSDDLGSKAWKKEHHGQVTGESCSYHRRHALWLKYYLPSEMYGRRGHVQTRRRKPGKGHQSSRPILAVAFPAMRATRVRGSSRGNNDASRTLLRPGYATARPWSNAFSVFLTTDSGLSISFGDT
jgi:hypothetical protein